MKTVYLYTDASTRRIYPMPDGPSAGAYVAVDRGGVVLARKGFSLGVQKSHTAELLAILVALRDMHALHFGRVCLHTDAAKLVPVIATGVIESNPGPNGGLYKLIRIEAVQFDRFQAGWIPRDFNIAHDLTYKVMEKLLQKQTATIPSKPIPSPSPKTLQVNRHGIPIMAQQRKKPHLRLTTP